MRLPTPITIRTSPKTQRIPGKCAHMASVDGGLGLLRGPSQQKDRQELPVFHLHLMVQPVLLMVQPILIGVMSQEQLNMRFIFHQEGHTQQHLLAIVARQAHVPPIPGKSGPRIVAVFGGHGRPPEPLQRPVRLELPV